MRRDGDRSPALEERLALRSRPAGSPLMYQSWGTVLFLHWPVPQETLRPLLPPGLALDTHEGRAWVALAPFTLWGLRPRFGPALPGVSRFHELNVRTYVHANGVPGVWFFSLDAARLLPVLGARALFFLPYSKARMSLLRDGETITYESVRSGPSRSGRPGAPRAAFRAVWTFGAARPRAVPGSLDFFLVERYCLYAERRGRLYRSRIHHEPWPLRDARLVSLEAAGFAQPAGAPLLHGGGPVDVEVWPLREV
jgi:uncharacterized protein YqjF (DUF2071 family)